MIERQRIATYGITTAAIATVALALWLKPWQSHSLVEPLPVPASAHRVDLVFAVDTTGSMGGLLDGAKRTVWSIASHIRQVDPDVDLRVGLVAYRDLGDEYVTKDLPLTTDLDAVFTELSGYIAAGGGDEPEDVDAALWDAVHKMAWRGDAKKMIFLVGDAPPASRNDVPRFEVSARDAHDRQIILNAIRCGNAEDTAVAWKQIAALGDGEFSSIAEDGGVQQVATPYDAKLADLSRTIDSTTVIYGAPALRGEDGGDCGRAGGLESRPRDVLRGEAIAARRRRHHRRRRDRRHGRRRARRQQAAVGSARVVERRAQADDRGPRSPARRRAKADGRRREAARRILEVACRGG
jgi:hypothetical protein